MDPAPWQHPTTLRYGSAAVLGGKTNHINASAAIFPRPCTLWFWLFPRLNIGLQHQHFATVEDIKRSVTAGCTPYRRMISTNVSKHDKTIGASVCVQKGCTSRVNRLEGYKNLKAEFWELFDAPTDLCMATWMSNPESNRIFFVNIS